MTDVTGGQKPPLLKPTEKEISGLVIYFCLKRQEGKNIMEPVWALKMPEMLKYASDAVGAVWNYFGLAKLVAVVKSILPKILLNIAK